MPASPDRAGQARERAWLHALAGPAARLAPGTAAARTQLRAAEVMLGACAHADDSQANDPTAWRDAALAHAAAHLQYGAAPFAAGTFKPIQRVLLGLFEDARVEACAMAVLPGLRALWAPFHRRHDAASGAAMEALLARLAHALFDPAYDDPHPWVRKARALYRAADPAAPAALRAIASRLGNDLGQMRIQFDARGYAVLPSYRDDNLHLWEPPPAAPDRTGEAAQPAGTADDADGGRAAGRSTPDDKAPDDAARIERHPEWDRLIGRYRADWCTVREADAPAGDARPLAARLAASGARIRHAQRLLQLAARRRARFVRGQRCADGDRLHPDAVLDARIAQRLRLPPDPRVYLAARRAQPRLAVLLMLDVSASTAQPLAPGARATLLDGLRLAALVAAAALERAGQRSAVQAFASDTRAAVRVLRVKRFGEAALAPAVLARAAGLASGGSTRLGAVVRHAARTLARERAPAAPGNAWVLVLTDGAPHDIDIHDPRYLPEDLRRAIGEARRAGSAVGVLDLARHAGGWRGVDACADHALRRVLAALDG